jgi:hypothetical protein
MSEPELSERPWEQPGAFRRDCESHRGNFLYFWSSIGLVLAAFSICFGIPGIIGLGIAIPVWIAAGRDLAKMDKGLMDPEGAIHTAAARDRAFVAVLVITLFLLAVGTALSWNFLTGR